MEEPEKYPVEGNNFEYDLETVKIIVFILLRGYKK